MSLGARSARYSLGWHWRVQRQYQEALSEFRAALLLAVELGDRPQEVLCQENIGDCLRELHRPEEAIAEYDRSFSPRGGSKRCRTGDVGRVGARGMPP
ncbi:MAG: tetratricopeptide repeat protein [Dehalococcoidia bacterium]|nr:tetratricopeptide repeat protein [Dehalococcoidia bacterium]